MPNGADAYEFFEFPTPGRANGAGLPGDVNDDQVVDILDVDALCVALRVRATETKYDLTSDGLVNDGDLRFLMQDVLGTNFGDANLDGQFNSTDLVQVFQAGQYEDAAVGNSTWRTGDWNCDGEFGTADLVAAFQAGVYVTAAVPTSLSANDLAMFRDSEPDSPSKMVAARQAIELRARQTDLAFLA